MVQIESTLSNAAKLLVVKHLLQTKAKPHCCTAQAIAECSCYDVFQYQDLGSAVKESQKKTNRDVGVHQDPCNVVAKSLGFSNLYRC